MKKSAARARWIGLTLVAWLGVSVPARASQVGFVDRFAALPTWNDGRAEISLYDTRGTKYGVERRYETRIIVVKEDLLEGSFLKSSEGPLPGRTFEALKLIVEHEIPTGTYSYRQSVVTHLMRSTLIPLSLAMNSIESCGLASVRMRDLGAAFRFRGSSYWESEGEVDTVFASPSGTIFYDALPLWVRGTEVEGADSLAVTLLPQQLSNHMSVPAPGRATVIRAPAGADTVLVSVRHAGGEDRFWIGTSPERPLLRWEKADGSLLVLRKRLRLAYWEHTKPGDEALLR